MKRYEERVVNITNVLGQHIIKEINCDIGQMSLIQKETCEMCGEESTVVDFDDCNSTCYEDVCICKDCLLKALEMLGE